MHALPRLGKRRAAPRSTLRRIEDRSAAAVVLVELEGLKDQLTPSAEVPQQPVETRSVDLGAARRSGPLPSLRSLEVERDRTLNRLGQGPASRIARLPGAGQSGFGGLEAHRNFSPPFGATAGRWRLSPAHRTGCCPEPASGTSLRASAPPFRGRGRSGARGDRGLSPRAGRLNADSPSLLALRTLSTIVSHVSVGR
jgi:hypothetical protein